MIFFLEFENYSYLTEFISQKEKVDLLNLLLSKVSNFSFLQTHKLQDWSELKNIISKNEELFEKNLNQENSFLFDIQSLNIDKVVTNYLQEISSNKQNIYLYSIEKTSLALQEKKLWQKVGFNYENLKQNKELNAKLAKEYTQKLQLNIDFQDLQKIIQNSSSCQEIIDNIDYVSLANDLDLAIKSLQKIDSKPIFMLPFDLKNLQNHSQIWLKNVNSENLQLALSLINTKLSNQKLSSKLRRELILTDQKIKTFSRVEGLIWFKLFLWKAQNDS
jgi:hypothetical protein